MIPHAGVCLHCINPLQIVFNQVLRVRVHILLLLCFIQ